HIDVMDNHYVPNLSFGPMVIQALRNKIPPDVFFDVHLMVQPVDNIALSCIDAGAQLVSFHLDACTHVHRTIHLLKSKGIKVGLAFNPAQSLEGLEWVLADLDLVLLMMVNPGFGGQTLISSVLPKIQRVRQMIDNLQKPIRIQVDGGIYRENIYLPQQAGADTFVVGSGIFKQPSYHQAIHQLRQELLNHPY
ncbi:MAG: ribulose-phosphate 3-epimerase, partial [Gammaproteobacteria bacterium]|nr:ribulose-phosphate 3-epimerase [Gammaproteobacteria bacterium]